MSSSVGLERITCPACEREQFFRVRDLVSATAASCPGCGVAVSVQVVEEENPHLARLLGILRQLERSRSARMQQDKGRTKGGDTVVTIPPDDGGAKE